MAVAKYWDAEQVRWITAGEPPMFFEDTFTAIGGGQNLRLTYVPLNQSEHVFKDGILQEEQATWMRNQGSNILQVFSSMGAQPGNKILVEYAYSSQVPSAGEVAPQYPHIVVPSSSTLIERFPGSTDEVWLPPPTGFPSVPSPSDPGNYWAWDSWHADYMAGNAGPAEAVVVSVGPPLAPGSTGSRQTQHLYGVYQPWHEILISAGDHAPRWGQATHIAMSVYYTTSAVAQHPLGTDFRSSDIIRFISWWEDPEDSYLLEFSLIYKAKDRRWYLYATGEQPWKEEWDLWWPEVDIPLTDPAWMARTPFDSGTHYATLYVDCIAKKVTVTWDDLTFSYTGPEVWPDPVIFDNEEMSMNHAYDGNLDMEAIAVNFDYPAASTPVTISTDQLTLDTDAPYDKWGANADPWEGD